MMSWSALYNSKLLFIILIGLGLLVWRLIKIRRAVTLLQNHHQQLLQNFSMMRAVIKFLLYGIALLFLFLALLGPQWDEKDSMVKQEGRDILVALDISGSMLAQDYEPNRLEVAKQKIHRLMKELDADRVALMLFSGTAFIQCPLTMDMHAFEMFLEQVDVESISHGSTAIDQALQQAIAMFAALPEHKSKIVVLVTDGEDFSTNLDNVKTEFCKQGIHLFALGIGSVEGAPIPVYNEQGAQTGHRRDKQANVVISRLNEPMLTTLAQSCGGMFIRATKNNDDIHTLVKYINAFEKEQFEEKKLHSYEQQYPYFVAVSFLCLLLEWLL